MDGRTSPLASSTSAVSDRLDPTMTDAVCGDTAMESTAAPSGFTAPLSHAVRPAEATPTAIQSARDQTTADCTHDSFAALVGTPVRRATRHFTEAQPYEICPVQRREF